MSRADSLHIEDGWRVLLLVRYGVASLLFALDHFPWGCLILEFSWQSEDVV
jgi:hypothetical protein